LAVVALDTLGVWPCGVRALHVKLAVSEQPPEDHRESRRSGQPDNALNHRRPNLSRIVYLIPDVDVNDHFADRLGEQVVPRSSENEQPLKQRMGGQAKLLLSVSLVLQL